VAQMGPVRKVAPMRVVVGSDERTTLTDAVAETLAEKGHEVSLMGPLAGGGQEWAEVGAELARRVASGEAEMGVLFCWTGTGASIAANKVPGARAALCGDAETARGARRYNHANVLVMSLRATSDTVGREILDAFLDEPPGTDEFDVRNVAAVDALDRRP
jgi:RpiB/LacA/LacB family sugar-phosphate isomerase